MLNIAESLYPGDGDDSFSDVVEGKVGNLPTDKIRAWLSRTAVNSQNSPRGAVFFNGQYQPLDEVSRSRHVEAKPGAHVRPLTFQRWTDRIMQDYMGQLNYLMQPASQTGLLGA